VDVHLGRRDPKLERGNDKVQGGTPTLQTCPAAQAANSQVEGSKGLKLPKTKTETCCTYHCESQKGAAWTYAGLGTQNLKGAAIDRLPTALAATRTPCSCRPHNRRKTVDREYEDSISSAESLLQLSKTTSLA
jgi:hypothetical protein